MEAWRRQRVSFKVGWTFYQASTIKRKIGKELMVVGKGVVSNDRLQTLSWSRRKEKKVGSKDYRNQYS